MNSRFVGRVVLLALLQFACATTLYAQATRTWVSGVGDDVNPCSRTAPCKTFAGAISKTASPGEIDALDPGGFGTVTITKSITIDGAGTMASILSSGVQGIVINALSTDKVIIRNISINGAGTTLGTNGIHVINAGSVTVENCNIFGFSGQGILVDNSANTINVTVVNTSLRNNNGGAIYTHPSGAGVVNMTVSGSLMQNNLRGLRVDDNSTVAVYNTVASNNINSGFVALSNALNPSLPSKLTIEGGSASLNGSGVFSQGGPAVLRFSNMEIMGNTSQGIQSVSGGSLISFGNNRVAGNAVDGAPTSTIGQL